MAMAKVVAAVEAMLAAWPAQHCPVRGFLDDEGAAPDDGSAFLIVQYPYATTAQITVGAPGANVFREEGALRLVLSVPRDVNGRATALAWADDLATLFRGKQFGGAAGFSGVTTWAPSSPVIDDRTDYGNYLILAIAVPYQADLIA